MVMSRFRAAPCIHSSSDLFKSQAAYCSNCYETRLAHLNFARFAMYFQPGAKAFLFCKENQFCHPLDSMLSNQLSSQSGKYCLVFIRLLGCLNLPSDKVGGQAYFGAVDTKRPPSSPVTLKSLDLFLQAFPAEYNDHNQGCGSLLTLRKVNRPASSQRF